MILTGEYQVKKVIHPHAIAAEVPGSKSITNRALLLAALAQGKSVLSGVLFSDDSRHFLQALMDLGFEVTVDEPAHWVEIVGCGGQIPAWTKTMAPEVSSAFQAAATIDVGSAGTAARFLTAFLGLSEGRYRMDASDQMKKRPMKELLTVLESLGAEIVYEGEPYHFPYIIGNGIRKEAGDAVVNSSCIWENRASVSCTVENCETKNSRLDNCEAENSKLEKCASDSCILENCPPAEITVNVDKSSQFLSALLITSVLFPNGITIHVTGSHGMAYVRMTAAMMRQFGLSIEVSEDERTYRIPAGSSYRPQEYVVEPDLSAACYFYAAGAILGVPAQVRHVHRNCLQGDIAFLSVLCDMGCRMREDEEGITLLPAGDDVEVTVFEQSNDRCVTLERGGGKYAELEPDNGSDATMERSDDRDAAWDPDTPVLHGGSWDLSSFSDQALTLAALAPFADSVVEIHGIRHIRYQECDRIRAILDNLRAMGVRCEEMEDGVRIYPANHSCTADMHTSEIHTHDSKNMHASEIQMHGARIETYEDHRVAMAFAIPGLRLDGQVIENPACCRKTFEEFFDVLERAVY